MKHLFKQPFFYTTLLSLIILGLIISNYVFGWTTPTQNPPAGNITLQSVTPGGSTGYVQFNNSGTFGGDANLFWDNTNKRLGIGTTVPGGPLDVNGRAGATSFKVASTFTDLINNAPWYGIGYSNLACAGGNCTQLAGYYGLHFQTASGQVRIDSSGNVGIGTTNPSEKLSVAGNIWIGGTGMSGYGGIIKSGTYPFETYLYYTDDGSGYGPAWIHTNTGSGGTTQPTMFLQTQGNSAKLNINSDLGLGPMTVTLGSYPSITTNVFIGGDSGDNSYFNTGGNVGIGTTAPGYKLDVSGDVRLTGNLIATSNTLDNCAWTAWTCNASQTCPTGQVVAGVQRYTTGALCGTAPTQWYQMSLYCCNL